MKIIETARPVLISSLFVFALAIQGCTKNDNDSAANLQKVTCENGKAIAAGIFGGEKVNSQSNLAKGMVLIYHAQGALGGSFCTGSLIDSNIILTAAHCVPAKGEKPEVVSVFWSVDPLCTVIQNGDESQVRIAEKIIVHPSYGNADSPEHGDVALIRISDVAPPEAIPATLVAQTEKLTADSKIMVAGFGKTTDYTNFEFSRQQMRFAMVKPFQGIAESSKDDVAKETRDLLKENLFFDQTGGHGACAGDSGGPSLLNLDGTWAIIGVASYVDPLKGKEFANKETTCRQGVAYSSVVYFKKWIQKSFLELRNDNSKFGLRWTK